MHICAAIKITDSTSSSSSTTAVINGVTMPNITGTVAANTTASYLYFSTNSGLMEIKIDSSTDLSNCRTLIPGQSISVACYRGSDAVMHAGRIVDNTISSSVSATVNTAKTTTVTGTVTYPIHLLSCCIFTKAVEPCRFAWMTAPVMNGCVLVIGESIQVTFAGGSDSYLHAVSIRN